MEQCRLEIEAIQTETRAGNPDLQGLRVGLYDWSAELRIIRDNTGLRTPTPAAGAEFPSYS
jgi:hypothetical protein